MKRFLAMLLCFCFLFSSLNCYAMAEETGNPEDNSALTEVRTASERESDVEPFKSTAPVVAPVVTDYVEQSTADASVRPHEHAYSSEVIAPTCTTAGYTQWICACGDSYCTDETEPNTHCFENGICQFCGAEEISIESNIIENVDSSANFWLDSPDFCFWDDAALTLHWGSVLLADNYVITLFRNMAVYGTYTVTDSTANQGEYCIYNFSSVLKNAPAGAYMVQVVAKGSGHVDSSPASSEELVIGYTRLAMPQNLRWDVANATISWDAVENAVSYRLDFDSEIGEAYSCTTTTTSYNYSVDHSSLFPSLYLHYLTGGDLYVFVYAVPANGTPYYESLGSFSRTVVGTQLAEPQNVQWDVPNQTLSWNPVAGASTYRIEFYGDAFSSEGEKRTVTGTSFSVSSIAAISGRCPFCAYVTALPSDSQKPKLLESASAYAGYYPRYTLLSLPDNVTWSDSTSTLSWDTVPNAEGYKISVDYHPDVDTNPYGTLYDRTVTTNFINLSSFISQYGKNHYKVEITALADDDGDYLDSYETLYYFDHGILLDKPQNLRLNRATMQLSWDAVANASGYRLVIDDEDGQHCVNTILTATSYDASSVFAVSEEKHYIVYVTPLADASSLYLDNGFARLNVRFDVIPLAAPLNLQWDAATQTLSWNAVPYAAGYFLTVYKNQALLSEISVSDTSFAAATLFSENGKGSYVIAVKALATTYGEYSDSEAALSAAFTYGISLGAPQHLSWNLTTKTLTWDAVFNATSYTVQLCGAGANQNPMQVYTNAFCVAGLLENLEPGLYYVTVQAEPSDEDDYLIGPTARSADLTHTKSLPAPQNAVWDANGGLSWNAVNHTAYYNVILKLNDTPVETVSAENAVYDFSTLIAQHGKGSYTADITAVAAAGSYYLNSEVYSTGAYEYGFYLETPQNICFDEDMQVLTWNAVTSACGYCINLYIGETCADSLSVTGTSLHLAQWLNAHGIGSYHVGVIALAGNSLQYYDSAESVHYPISYKQRLQKPRNLFADEQNNILSWNTVPNAVSYSVAVYRNNQYLYSLLTAETSLGFENLFTIYGNGCYRFAVKAVANPDSFYLDSNESIAEEILHGVRLASPVVTWENAKGLLKWTSVQYAMSYELKLYRNGQPVETINLGSAVCSYNYESMAKGFGKGVYIAEVTALPNEDGGFIPSESVWSEEWSYGVSTLAQPVAYWDYATQELHWTKVKGATSYRLMLLLPQQSRAGVQPVTVNSSVFSYGFRKQLAAADENCFKVYLCAVKESGNSFAQSEWTEIAVDKTSKALNTPQNLVWRQSKTVLTWDGVTDAVGYCVTLRRLEGGIYRDLNTWMTDVPAIDLKQQLEYYGAGQYDATVCACPAEGSNREIGYPAASDVIERGKRLSTPSVSWNSKLLCIQWKAVSNASAYHVRIVRNGQLLYDNVTDALFVDMLSYLQTQDIGKYEAYVTAYATPGIMADSATAKLKFTISKSLYLSAPSSLTCTNLKLKWKAVSHAGGYQISIDRLENAAVNYVTNFIADAKSTSVNLQHIMNVPGLYRITFQALAAENSGVFDALPVSIEVLVETMRLKAPKNLHWVEKAAAWSAVENALGYEVKLTTASGEVYTGITTGLIYDFSTVVPQFEEQCCSFCVRSLSDGVGGYATSEYSYSSVPYLTESNCVDAPSNLYWNGKKLCWGSVENAISYVLQVWSNTGVVTDELYLESGVLSYDLTDVLPLKKSAVRVSLQAINASGIRSDIAWSEWYCYKCTTLPAAENLLWDGRTAKWDKVKNANRYLFELYELNSCGQRVLRYSRVLSSSKKSFDCADLLAKYGLGQYAFEITALGVPTSGTADGPSRQSPVLSLTELQQIMLAQDTYTLNGSPNSTQKIKLKPTCYGGAKLTYLSDSALITVNEKGEIRVPKNFIGTAMITVTARAKGDYPEISRQVTVNVNRIANIINGKDFSVNAHQSKTQSFSLGISVKDGAMLHFESNQPWLTINEQGKASLLPGYFGNVVITVHADAVGCYLPVDKTITLTVKPLKNGISVSGNQKLSVSSAERSYQLNASNKQGLPMKYSCSDAAVRVADGIVTIPAGFTGIAVITVSTDAYGAYGVSSKQVTFTVKPY